MGDIETLVANNGGMGKFLEEGDFGLECFDLPDGLFFGLRADFDDLHGVFDVVLSSQASIHLPVGAFPNQLLPKVL